MRNSNITKNRIRVALLLVLAASIIGLAPAFSASARAARSFSVNDVSGNYVELANGWTFSNSDVNFLPNSQVALVTFTPATGTFHEEVILRVAGDNIYNILDGTYTVDATGHGTMTWLSGEKHRDFYIVNGGAELKWIITDPPGTHVIASNSGTMTRQ